MGISVTFHSQAWNIFNIFQTYISPYKCIRLQNQPLYKRSEVILQSSYKQKFYSPRIPVSLYQASRFPISGEEVQRFLPWMGMMITPESFEQNYSLLTQRRTSLVALEKSFKNIAERLTVKSADEGPFLFFKLPSSLRFRRAKIKGILKFDHKI